MLIIQSGTTFVIDPEDYMSTFMMEIADPILGEDILEPPRRGVSISKVHRRRGQTTKRLRKRASSDPTFMDPGCAKMLKSSFSSRNGGRKSRSRK